MRMCPVLLKKLIEDWRIVDNMNRRHSAHGDLTPNELAQV